MFRSAINRILAKLGYEIRRSNSIDMHEGSEIYQYIKSDGSFDYELYKQVQSEGNKQKIDEVLSILDNENIRKEG